MMKSSELEAIAMHVRRGILEMTSAAGSGHPTSCLSAADLMTALWFNELSFDPQNPHQLNNDQFVLSKGHAAPLYYLVLKHTGCIHDALETLRTEGSALEGHPMPRVSPWISAATGSLGQGLALAAGIALGARMQKSKARVYTLLGDSECAEGSVWEAAQFASYYSLANLCAIIDVNRLGQRGETMLGHDTRAYKKRFESLGWATFELNGHRMNEISNAFKKARLVKKPCVLIAKTIKGKGVSFLENKEGWHGKVLDEIQLRKALKELLPPPFPHWTPQIPEAFSGKAFPPLGEAAVTSYDLNEEVASREGYGKGLARYAVEYPSIVALDAEVSNSTCAEKVKERTPEQFIECFIAEQTLIGVAQGLSIRGYRPFASSFAAFLSRAHDQLRMAALSGASFSVCGSHAGVSIGEDGPSQMGLEDIACMRALPHATILCPSDAISAEKLVQLAAHTPGLTYLRTTRPKTPLVYKPKEEFIVNEFKALRLSPNDSAVLVSFGVTLHEALKAHALLKKQGVSTAVIDAYCLKPFPAGKFVDFVKAHGGRVVVIEDHYYEGGLGELVAHALMNTSIRMHHSAVRDPPRAGNSMQLLASAKLDALSIVAVTHELVKH